MFDIISVQPMSEESNISKEYKYEALIDDKERMVLLDAVKRLLKPSHALLSDPRLKDIFLLEDIDDIVSIKSSHIPF